MQYEQLNYEGYAPNGVAVLVECLSDNRNRTGSEIKNIFSRNGGSLAEPGAVSWQFERKGIIITAAGADEEQVMLVALDAGAEHVLVLNNDAVLLNLRTEQYYSLDPVGTRIWQLLGETRSLEATIQRVLAEPYWWNLMKPKDFRALSPLIYANINPYGVFDLDMSTRLSIEEMRMAA